jgi:hypothetical protein
LIDNFLDNIRFPNNNFSDF